MVGKVKTDKVRAHVKDAMMILKEDWMEIDTAQDEQGSRQLP